MPLPPSFAGRLRLPVVVAPMFLASGPDLVVASCKAGMIGTFPALNQRSSEGFARWLEEVAARLGPDDAPFGVNLIVHKSNPRLAADLDQVVAHRVPLVVTSLGAAAEVVEAVHAYGGVVFHDVVNLRHAEKAAAAGVDGLVLVAAGAGGHGGTLNPFALVQEVRAFFDGTILLAGAISSGDHVAAAQLIGADLAYMGTRFLATRECMAQEAYKAMLLEARAADIVYTAAVSGVPANYLRQSLVAAGVDPDGPAAPYLSERPRKETWHAGQGVGAITDVVPLAELADRLEAEYRQALRRAARLGSVMADAV